jgi:hypothetical protein
MSSLAYNYRYEQPSGYIVSALEWQCYPWNHDPNKTSSVTNKSISNRASTSVHDAALGCDAWGKRSRVEVPPTRQGFQVRFHWLGDTMA